MNEMILTEIGRPSVDACLQLFAYDQQQSQNQRAVQ
jgi:hypothetical protein